MWLNVFSAALFCFVFEQTIGYMLSSELKSILFSPNGIFPHRKPEMKQVLARSGKLKHASSSVNTNFEQSCFDPDDLITRTGRALFTTGQEPFRIRSFRFSVPTRTTSKTRQRQVAIERLSLFGLSDFTFIQDAKLDENGGCPVMYFKWSRLRAIGKIITEIEGLKSSGEAEVRTEEPLLMRVHLLKSELSDPQIEMTQVNDVVSEIQGLETIPEDSTAAIRGELESMLKRTINSQVRDVLIDFVQNSLLKQSSSKVILKVDEP